MSTILMVCEDCDDTEPVVATKQHKWSNDTWYYCDKHCCEECVPVDE